MAEEVPALEFIDAEVRAAVDVQQRRGESLDTKAGLCLGIGSDEVSVRRVVLDTRLPTYDEINGEKHRLAVINANRAAEGLPPLPPKRFLDRILPWRRARATRY